MCVSVYSPFQFTNFIYVLGSASLGSPIGPGSSLTYIYNVTDQDGPSAASGEECVTSLYYSDVNLLKDVNSGLVGMIVVCKPGRLTLSLSLLSLSLSHNHINIVI